MANLVCSQFVVLVMQMALGKNHPSYIKLDGHYTPPNTLRSYLKAAGAHWRVVGPHNLNMLMYGVAS